MAGKPENLAAAKEWFSLANYAGCRDFSSHEWGQQIARRAILLQAIKEKWQSVLDEMVPVLLDAPLSPWGFNSNSVPVKGLALKDMDRLNTWLDRKALPLDQPIDDFTTLVCNIDLSLGMYGHIIIDLNARDEDIKKAFNQWLSHARSRQLQQIQEATSRAEQQFESINNLRQESFRAWRNNKLLPYCDLKAWAAWKRVTLTEPQLVELLFPHESDRMRDKLRPVTDNVKKYITISNATALMAA